MVIFGHNYSQKLSFTNSYKGQSRQPFAGFLLLPLKFSDRFPAKSVPIRFHHSREHFRFQRFRQFRWRCMPRRFGRISYNYHKFYLDPNRRFGIDRSHRRSFHRRARRISLPWFLPLFNGARAHAPDSARR